MCRRRCFTRTGRHTHVTQFQVNKLAGYLLTSSIPALKNIFVLHLINLYLSVRGSRMKSCSFKCRYGIYLGFHSIGIGPIPWVLMSEIFRINMKGIAGSLVVFANWFCSWVLCYAFNFLMSWSSSAFGSMMLQQLGGVNAIGFYKLCKVHQVM